MDIRPILNILCGWQGAQEWSFILQMNFALNK